MSREGLEQDGDWVEVSELGPGQGACLNEVMKDKNRCLPESTVAHLKIEFSANNVKNLNHLAMQE